MDKKTYDELCLKRYELFKNRGNGRIPKYLQLQYERIMNERKDKEE